MISYIDDGIYSVPTHAVVIYIEEEIDDEESSEVLAFEKKYGNCFIASAYGTDGSILISERPVEAQGQVMGTGFNYGSTNIISDCPRRLLIVAQNG